VVFGFCYDRHHGSCPGEYERFSYERNKVVYLGEMVECECKCHKKKKT
jgi:hypothetical protein